MRQSLRQERQCHFVAYPVTTKVLVLIACADWKAQRMSLGRTSQDVSGASTRESERERERERDVLAVVDGGPGAVRGDSAAGKTKEAKTTSNSVRGVVHADRHEGGTLGIDGSVGEVASAVGGAAVEVHVSRRHDGEVRGEERAPTGRAQRVFRTGAREAATRPSYQQSSHR